MNEADAPRISVIIPTVGRELALRRALEALSAQLYPRRRFEILVSFDGWTASAAAAAACDAAGAKRVQLDRRLGPGAARNAAARLAQGDVLAFTEDDCVAAPTWLASAARRFDEHPEVDVLEGRTVKPNGQPIRRQQTSLPLYLPTNLFVRRDRFEEVGGYCEDYFDPGSGTYFREDADFGFALEASGAHVVLDNTVVVTHPEEHPGFLDPIHWARRYVMDPLLARRHPERFRDRIEVVRFGGLGLRRPFVRACVGYAIGLIVALAGLLGSSPVVEFIGASVALLALVGIWAKWRFNLKRLPLIPVVPFVLLYSLAEGELRARRITRRSTVTI